MSRALLIIAIMVICVITASIMATTGLASAQQKLVGHYCRDRYENCYASCSNHGRVPGSSCYSDCDAAFEICATQRPLEPASGGDQLTRPPSTPPARSGGQR